MNADVQIRSMPYPYKAMLAICSDLDETPNRHTYLGIMRFLNTMQDTSMGPGVGLEVGNSIYFDMPQEQFAYWNTDEAGREIVRTLIKSGHIDCLHSYGDLAVKRKHAARALDELDRYGCKLQVWVDHGVAPTNFGSDIMCGHGDEIGHPAYHADLTTGFGIQYVWRGRVTSITGQNVPDSLGGLFKISHPAASGLTILKEAAKIMMARIGNKKYALHSINELMRPVVLRDNNKVYEFIRSNPHWGGVSSCDGGRYIGETLTKDMLNRLIKRGGLCILYTHLGKIDNLDVPFNQMAVEAFRYLAKLFQKGDILVTTTKRLLDYQRAIRKIIYKCTQDEKKLQIRIDTLSRKNTIRKLPITDLNGLTFYVPEQKVISLTIDGSEVKDLQYNMPDHLGRPSVSLKWQKLEFPQI